MSKKSWSCLRPGDIVDVVAPASNSTLHKLEDGIKWIEDTGLIPRVPHDIIQTDLFFAAPLEIQLKHLKEAIYAEDSRAIWCLRGGYGSMRLVPFLKKLKPPKRPKLFIGFSDITSLHLFFSQEWNWPVIHGRTISQMNPEHAGTPDRVFLKKLIFGEQAEHTFKNLVPLNQHALRKQIIRAKITGGNLRIVQSSLGTAWEMKAKNKILFLEDVGERGYSVHRMLEQMIQAKIIDRGLKALVFGDFTEGLERDGKNLIPDAIQRFADKAPYPVFSGLPSGHGHDNWPVPFNTMCTLMTGKKAELSCSYGSDS